jgi:hypothetical protein
MTEKNMTKFMDDILEVKKKLETVFVDAQRGAIAAAFGYKSNAEFEAALLEQHENFVKAGGTVVPYIGGISNELE